MARIARISVTFPPELLGDFDEITRKMGYVNRSKAIQDAVRSFVSERKLLQREAGMQAGVLMLVYDHDVKGLENMLTHIQHHYMQIISSTMHIHISERECLEVIAVKGEASEIKQLSNELASKTGVKILKTTIVSV